MFILASQSCRCVCVTLLCRLPTCRLKSAVRNVAICSKGEIIEYKIKQPWRPPFLGDAGVQTEELNTKGTSIHNETSACRTLVFFGESSLSLHAPSL